MSARHLGTETSDLACRCGDRGYVRSLEEDDWGFPAKVEPLAETSAALLGRCRWCGTWWEHLPHWVYGYAWYRVEQVLWGEASLDAAITTWTARRQDPEI
jgi:hypothetical protein